MAGAEEPSCENRPDFTCLHRFLRRRPSQRHRPLLRHPHRPTAAYHGAYDNNSPLAIVQPVRPSQLQSHPTRHCCRVSDGPGWAGLMDLGSPWQAGRGLRRWWLCIPRLEVRSREVDYQNRRRVVRIGVGGRVAYGGGGTEGRQGLSVEWQVSRLSRINRGVGVGREDLSPSQEASDRILLYNLRICSIASDFTRIAKIDSAAC